jgi:hypothetical protein
LVRRLTRISHRAVFSARRGSAGTAGPRLETDAMENGHTGPEFRAVGARFMGG